MQFTDGDVVIDISGLYVQHMSFIPLSLSLSSSFATIWLKGLQMQLTDIGVDIDINGLYVQQYHSFPFTFLCQNHSQQHG